jgi:hypothetical protein
MRLRPFLAASLLAIAAITACQPTPGGGTESGAPPGTIAASAEPAGDGPEASATPNVPPGY